MTETERDIAIWAGQKAIEAREDNRRLRAHNAELLAALEAMLIPCPPGTHTIGPDGVCPECPVEKQARAAIAKGKLR